MASDVSTLIAQNLHQIPHPKHGEVRLMGFRPFTLSQQPPEVREQVNTHAQAVGEGIENLLKLNGKTVVDTTELERLRAIAAGQEPGTKVAKGFCQHCGCELIRLAVDDHLQAHLHRIAIQAAGINHSCWT